MTDQQDVEGFEMVSIDPGYGLGKCGQCVSEYLLRVRDENAGANGSPVLENPDDSAILWAVCLVPAWSNMMVGPGQMAAGVCAVGSCLRHINVGRTPPKAPGAGLLVAGGPLN